MRNVDLRSLYKGLVFDVKSDAMIGVGLTARLPSEACLIVTHQFQADYIISLRVSADVEIAG